MNDSQGLWGNETRHFHLLTPDHVMAAVESLGKRLTGRNMALNSLENRVYDVELAQSEDMGPGFSKQNVIVKFYRPGRWSKEQIQEEHTFLNTLTEFEVPVCPPLEVKGQTVLLNEETNLYYALFPKVMGRLKDEFNKEETEQAGRLIGRIHNIGSMGTFTHRLSLSPTTFIKKSAEALTDTKVVDHPSFNYYISLLPQLEALITPMISHLPVQRLHGDFHRGNIVWTSAGPIAVDFDDCLTGPIEQDLWLLNAGTDEESLKERDHFLSAYREMTRKDHLRMDLTEVFRAMRMVHFNAWIAKRWEDHSFKRIFPQFSSAGYWDNQLVDLRVQISQIQERAGTMFG
jgi:Ser/Thr protein kinase RdoA (MazF antagonist)